MHRWIVGTVGAVDADYADALRRHWPNERATARDHAALMAADHGGRFEQGAARAARSTASFGRDSSLGGNQVGTAASGKERAR